MTHPIIQQLRNECPEFLPTIVACVSRAYAEVCAMLTQSRIKDEYWEDALPHMLHSAMQKQFFETFSMCETVDAATMLNAGKNCHHVELKMLHMVFTVNALAENENMPREAVFREQLSGQISLFDVMTDRSSEDANIYLAVVHKRDKVQNKPKDIRLISMSDLGIMGVLNASIMNEVAPEEQYSAKEPVLIANLEIITAGDRLRLKK